MKRDTEVIKARMEDDEVAKIFETHDLFSAPVVDENMKLLGRITVDDVVDVVIEEATEDAQKMGGVVPLEDSYFQTGWAEFVWKRGSWLVLLFLALYPAFRIFRKMLREQNTD